MTEQSAFSNTMRNITHPPNTDEYEIALEPLCKSPAIEKTFNDGESTASYYQDLEDERLSGVYQSLGKKNEPPDNTETIYDTSTSSQETGKETLIIENETARQRQVSKSEASRVNDDENDQPSLSYETPQQECKGSHSDNIYCEPINVRQKDATNGKESGAFYTNLEKQSDVRHLSNRRMLLIMTAMLFLTIVTFVLVILHIFGVIGTQCTCNNQPLTEAADISFTRMEIQKNLSQTGARKVDAELNMMWGAINSTKLSYNKLARSLENQINNVSKMEGPIGPRGHNGSSGYTGAQGPVGPQGIQGAKGFNGSQGQQGPVGPQGIQGAKGFNGSQGPQGPQGQRGPAGPKGAGDFSQCTWKEIRSSRTLISGASTFNDVILTTSFNKKVVGVTCSSIGMVEHNLERKVLVGTERYICSCAGEATGPLKSTTGFVRCILNYWECPITT